MKNLYKNILLVGLLISFSLSASAQVTQIHEPSNSVSSNIKIKPKLRIENNQLYAITTNGVYLQNLDEYGNLTSNDLDAFQILESYNNSVRDLLVCGNSIILSTTDALLRSEDNGDSWEVVIEHPVMIERGKINNTEECFAILDYTTNLFHSLDFGKTWEETGTIIEHYIKTHPLDSQVTISRETSNWAVVDNKNFYITYDYGKTWNDIGSFIEATDAAFHYSNPDIMVVIGKPNMASKDYGKTWETTCEEFLVDKANFDTRGSDRLYGTREGVLLYSDDIGANWTNLCKMEGNISNFTQQNDKIYAITTDNKVYQIDLSLLEASIDVVSAESMGVTLSVAGDILKVNAQTPVTNIEVYNVGGIKLLSQPMTDGTIDISDLLQGTYIARLQTADGSSLSVKFNK